MSNKRALLCALLCFQTLQFAQASVQADAVFNTPGFKGHLTPTIENKVIELIDSAAPGSIVRGAFFSFYRREVAEAFLRAAQRKVDVRIVFDGNIEKAELKNREALQILRSGTRILPPLTCQQEPCIKICDSMMDGISKAGGSCRGFAVNHNKFILFSKLTTGEKHVVVQTSANMNRGQQTQYQDLLIIKNDEKLFTGFRSYWTGLLQDKTAITVAHPRVTGTNVTAEFFPRLVGFDPVVSLLERVRCIPGSVIRVAQSAFTRGEVARQLRLLAHAGCDVKVIVRDDKVQHSPSPAVVGYLKDRLTILPFDRETELQIPSNSNHSKIILIRASIDKSPNLKSLVVTGSHNLDLFSLRANDEVLLQIYDHNLYLAYLDFWNRILADAISAGVIDKL